MDGHIRLLLGQPFYPGNDVVITSVLSSASLLPATRSPALDPGSPQDMSRSSSSKGDFKGFENSQHVPSILGFLLN